MKRDQREYGLSESDRDWVVKRKFGFFSRRKVKNILTNSKGQSDKVLGAILFLARPGNFSDLESGVSLANENVTKLLNAAAVKEERG